MFALLRRIIRTLFLCSCNARYIWVVPSSSAVLETVYRYENERRRTSLTALNRHRHSFLRAAAMQARISCEPDVRPSVCPSVCQTRGLWQNERKFCPDFYTVRKII